MNIVVLTGRLVADPEIRTLGESRTKQCEITLAVDKMHRTKDSTVTAYFPMVQFWGKKAEFIEKWCKKGTKIEVAGELQTQSYLNKAGDRVYKTFVLADSVGFAESRRAQQEATVAETPTEEPTIAQSASDEPKHASPAVEENIPQPKKSVDEWMDIPEGFDEDSVPFS